MAGAGLESGLSAAPAQAQVRADPLICVSLYSQAVHRACTSCSVITSFRFGQALAPHACPPPHSPYSLMMAAAVRTSRRLAGFEPRPKGPRGRNGGSGRLPRALCHLRGVGHPPSFGIHLVLGLSGTSERLLRQAIRGTARRPTQRRSWIRHPRPRRPCAATAAAAAIPSPALYERIGTGWRLAACVSAGKGSWL